MIGWTQIMLLAARDLFLFGVAFVLLLSLSLSPVSFTFVWTFFLFLHHIFV